MTQRRFSPAFPFLLLFAALSSAAAFSQTIEILPAIDQPDEADPGTVFTKAFFISNRGSLQENYAAELTLPEGWRIVAFDANPVIPLKSGDTVFATVYVPPEAAAGAYPVKLRIHNAETGEETASYGFDLLVREKPGFKIVTINSPDYAIAGEVYQSLFRLQNTGNVALKLLIDVDSRPGLDYVSEIRRTELPAGRSRIFAVSVRSDQSAAGRIRHTLKLTASDEAGKLRAQDATSTVNILPRISGEEQPYRTLPVGIAVKQGLRHAASDTYGILAQVSARGPLSQSGGDEFSGYVKVPFDREGALFKEDSEIAVSYKDDPFDIFVGQRFFSVSTLTEDSLYGTGARVEYAKDGLLIGAHHTDTAFSPPSVSQTAMWYGREFGDSGTLRLNLVDSVNKVGPGSIDFITSVEVRKTPEVGPNTVFEYASGAFHGSGDACLLALNDTISGFSYALETIHADADYGGEIRDSKLYSARLRLPLGSDLTVMAGLRNRYSLLEQPVPALTEGRNLGFRMKIGEDSGLGVSYLQTNDANCIEKSSLSTEGVRLDFNHTAGRLLASLGAHLSRSFEKATADEAVKELYTGSLLYNLGGRTLRGFSSISTTRGSESSRILTFGVDYSAEFGERAGMRLAYRSSSKAASYYAGQDSIRGSFYFNIAEGQRMILQGGYAPKRSTGRMTDFNISVEYHASLNLPIGLRDVGKIAGMVTDIATGRGVPDVIVRIGDRVAISDLSGRFLFLSMDEGPYSVGVDLSRLREERIVRAREPLDVNVVAGETADIEIFLIEPGVITGTVKRFTRDSNGGLVEAGGIDDLLLEVIGEFRKVRILTDRNGNFRTGGLTPGEWVVTIASSQLSDDTYVETDTPVINLSDGEVEEVFLGVYPVKREIQMIDEGTIRGNGD